MSQCTECYVLRTATDGRVSHCEPCAEYLREILGESKVFAVPACIRIPYVNKRHKQKVRL